MHVKLFLPLLYTGTFGILFFLALLAGYTLNQQSIAEAAEPVAFCGTISPSASPAFQQGKNVWNANACGSCHNKDMKSEAIGPALRGVTARWAAYPREDLYAWIRNSQQLVAAGHPRAVEVWTNWKPTVMTSFSNLTEEEMENLLVYIESDY